MDIDLKHILGAIACGLAFGFVLAAIILPVRMRREIKRRRDAIEDATKKMGAIGKGQDKG